MNDVSLPCRCMDKAWGVCPQHGKKTYVVQTAPSTVLGLGIGAQLTESEREQLLAPDPNELTICVPSTLTLAGETCVAGMTPAPHSTDPESILQEAHRLTHGPRRADYGHPLDDYNRTAALVSALLAHKLKEPLTADEMALAMVCVKLSRQVHFRKRDNTVDGAGYFWVAQECLDEMERRKTT